MKTIFLSSVFALLFAGFCSAQSNVLKTSDPLTWQKLSEIDLTFDGRGAEIPLYEKEKFASLHFRLLNAQLELQTAEITFDNGEKQSVVLNQRLYAQQHSGIIDLSGDRRILKKCSVYLQTYPQNGRPTSHHTALGQQSEPAGKEDFHFKQFTRWCKNSCTEENQKTLSVQAVKPASL